MLADAPRKGGSPLGVQFFGTCQVAWVAGDETSIWGEGIRRNYYGREKKQKKYKLAMTQVLWCLLLLLNTADCVWLICAWHVLHELDASAPAASMNILCGPGCMYMLLPFLLPKISHHFDHIGGALDLSHVLHCSDQAAALLVTLQDVHCRFWTSWSQAAPGMHQTAGGRARLGSRRRRLMAQPPLTPLQLALQLTVLPVGEHRINVWKILCSALRVACCLWLVQHAAVTAHA